MITERSNDVFVGNDVDIQQNCEHIVVVVGGEVPKSFCIVLFGVDELEQELKMIWIIFLKIDDVVRSFLHISELVLDE